MSLPTTLEELTNFINSQISAISSAQSTSVSQQHPNLFPEGIPFPWVSSLNVSTEIQGRSYDPPETIKSFFGASRTSNELSSAPLRSLTHKYPTVRIPTVGSSSTIDSFLSPDSSNKISRNTREFVADCDRSQKRTENILSPLLAQLHLIKQLRLFVDFDELSKENPSATVTTEQEEFWDSEKGLEALQRTLRSIQQCSSDAITMATHALAVQEREKREFIAEAINLPKRCRESLQELHSPDPRRLLGQPVEDMYERIRQQEIANNIATLASRSTTSHKPSYRNRRPSIRPRRSGNRPHGRSNRRSPQRETPAPKQS
jgi:hypothetical protein